MRELNKLTGINDNFSTFKLLVKGHLARMTLGKCTNKVKYVEIPADNLLSVLASVLLLGQSHGDFVHVETGLLLITDYSSHFRANDIQD